MHTAPVAPTWPTHPRIDRARALEFGVATSGFQTEGDLNEPGAPSTHWHAWERAGRIESSVGGAGLWRRFPEAARRAQAMGLTRFRMGIEWARLAPADDVLIPDVVDAYADRIVILREHGLEPIVTLLHFTHPARLGMDFWLTPDAPLRFTRYAREVVTALGEALLRRGSPPIRRFVTLNEPNMLALANYGAGVFPHEAPAMTTEPIAGFGRVVRCLDALLASHTLAWDAIHTAYAARGWAQPDVSTNVNVLDLYSLSKLCFDLLAPGLDARALEHRLEEGRYRHHATLFEGERRSRRALVAQALDALLARALRPARFDATRRALEVAERHGRSPFDHIAIDVYDPFTAQQVFVRPLRLAEPWEWRAEPETLLRALRAYAWPDRTLPLDVDENGMCIRRDRGGPPTPRADGGRRAAFLRGYVSSLLQARVVDDLPVRTYCHWTLVDNYELGRWAPRFGIFALRDDGLWSEHDATGENVAEAYGAIARALRAADDGTLRATLVRAVRP
jgi:beta-glucosidase/6-phospho-beta-glucosidase/beta-galactosidase